MEISSLIDTGLLRSLQTQFCRGCGIYMYCLGGDYEPLTDMFGSAKERIWLAEHIPEEHYHILIDRCRTGADGQILEQPVGSSGLRLCGVGISISGKDQITWIVSAVLREPEGKLEIPDDIITTEEQQFYRSLELLSQMSRQLFAAKMGEAIAQDAMINSQASKRKIVSQLHRSEAMTEIVRMLESDNEFRKIIDDVIKEACHSLNIQTGVLLQENTEHTIDMICAYRSGSESDILSREQNIDRRELPFYDGGIYVYSADYPVTEELEQFCRDKHITLGMFLPIYNNEQAVMYLCFCDNTSGRGWTEEEIKFLRDVKRIVQGIFSKRVAANSLKGSYVALEQILENTGCGIYVLDPQNREMLFANQRFRELFANTIEQGLLGSAIAIEQDIPNSFQEVYIPPEERWVDMNKTKIRWVDGREVCLCTIYDVTDKKNYQKKIESQANNDFLTGLFNRMRCEQDLEVYIHEAVQSSKEGALLYLDLDDFKHINDALGHQYGDILLKEISDSIRKIRGVENNCYRMGGDEFIVIVRDMYFQQLSRIVQDIQDVFKKPWLLNGDDYYCTMCMGIVCFPTDADSVGDVIRKADMALYEAKRRGKNKVEFYNDTEADSPYRRLDLENNIRRATLNAISEFEVFYQPIFDISGEEDACCGAEALARWNSSEMGFISPGDFIPIAEYLGLITPIGDHIMERAAKSCKHWNDNGHPDYHVNVNLSVIQLLQKDIVEKVRKVLTDTQVNPANIRLEVTESLAINDIDRMVMILSQIKELGVGVALDDFGTGYSSLNHIRKLPIDVIKIDKCFIDHIADDDFSQAFVKMVVQLASAIDVQVCVEGVEVVSQYRRVKDAHVDMIQGYYFGKPMRREDFEKKYL